MKLSIGLVFLLALLAFSMDHLEARKTRHSPIGICVELCSGDQDCPGRGRCVSNGCGHVCSHG
ncbi:protein Wfdc21-like [Notamacropus eugenii]|uniref:protein Wfdc21-like n=1 Tax=Notamacropus eugenii TaxID=9315 RepID=UPI003B66B304